MLDKVLVNAARTEVLVTFTDRPAITISNSDGLVLDLLEYYIGYNGELLNRKLTLKETYARLVQSKHIHISYPEWVKSTEEITNITYKEVA